MEEEEKKTEADARYDELLNKFNDLVSVVGSLTQQMQTQQEKPIVVEQKKEEPSINPDEAFIEWFKEL